jgi:16S rRNA (guanine966-N2)-methyltransferase
VREAIFSMLASIEDARVLDLFAGTGALGIEALSRGAGRAVFVERDRRALSALRMNLEDLELRPPEAEVRAGGALEALRGAREEGEAYDLVFVDPPYQRAPIWASELSVALPAALAPGARVVVESDRRMPLSLNLEIERERRYGDTSVTILRHP